MEEIGLEQLKSEFRKLIDQVGELPNTNEILQEMLDLNKRFERATEQISVLLNIGGRARAVINPRDYSLLCMPLFLWVFEGQYVARLDLVCLMLTACGHDLFNPIKRKYASSLEEISEVDISTKFKFLERHKMKMLIRKRDQRLRNKIAHQDFHIDEKGIISVDGNVIDSYARLLDLQSFVNEVTIALKECFLKNKA